MKKLMLAMAVAAVAAELAAVQGSISTAAETVTGDIKWRARDKRYVIQMGKVTKEFALDDVTGLNIPRPAGFDKAVEAVEAGQGSAAIPTLSKIADDYRMLTWDKPAVRALALAHLAAGNAKKAYDVCAEVIADDKSAAYAGELAAAYWQVLLKLGKSEQLEQLLKKAAASGSRAASAAALVMRGDILFAESDSPEAAKRALTEGYLRVVLMYQDADCARERREALTKAAACFERLGQKARAEKLLAQARAK